jgi:HK97 family phage prohead protease
VTVLEHKAVEATTRVDSDLGEFAAIAATYDVDRVKDRIRPGAFEKTIARWRSSGQRIPLHWAHRGEAKNVIGSVDPATMREIAGAGLYVEGKLDLDDSEVAREAWRSMKDNRVGLSFGYMTVKSQRRDGINDLLELDLFEISIAPGPINPQTRILEMKSAPAAAQESRGLRRRCDELAMEVALGCPLDEFRERHAATPARRRVPTDAELRTKARELGITVPLSYSDRVRAEAKSEMVACLRGTDEQAGGR